MFAGRARGDLIERSAVSSPADAVAFLPRGRIAIASGSEAIQTWATASLDLRRKADADITKGADLKPWSGWLRCRSQ